MQVCHERLEAARVLRDEVAVQHTGPAGGEVGQIAVEHRLLMPLSGAVKRSSARSFSGLKTTIGVPRRTASCSVVIIRGWLVPGLWPNEKIASAWSKSSSDAVPLQMPMDIGRPTLVALWHMFEQSGKLLVP